MAAQDPPHERNGRRADAGAGASTSVGSASLPPRAPATEEADHADMTPLEQADAVVESLESYLSSLLQLRSSLRNVRYHLDTRLGSSEALEEMENALEAAARAAAGLQAMLTNATDGEVNTGTSALLEVDVGQTESLESTRVAPALYKACRDAGPGLLTRHSPGVPRVSSLLSTLQQAIFPGGHYVRVPPPDETASRAESIGPTEVHPKVTAGSRSSPSAASRRGALARMREALDDFCVTVGMGHSRTERLRSEQLHDLVRRLDDVTAVYASEFELLRKETLEALRALSKMRSHEGDDARPDAAVTPER